MKFISVGIVKHAVLAAAVALAASLPRSANAQQEARAWEDSHDARLGVTLAHPAGWTLRTSGYFVIAQSADKTSFVIAEAFAGKAGETAGSHVTALPAAHPSLFPNATIDRTDGTRENAVLGSITFQGDGGKPETARVLCSMYKGSGMLYAIAGPVDGFDTERAKLLKILQSIRFGAATGSKSAIIKTPASAVASAPKLKYVSWTDPKEGAFKAEAPDGWKLDGGLYRYGPTDLRQALTAVSPDGIGVMIGDSTMPATYSIPDLLFNQYHLKEGQSFHFTATQTATYMHYMPALEFNRWYLEQKLKQQLPDLAISKEIEMPEQARKQADAANSLAGIVHTEVSIGVSEFSGTNQSNGKALAGTILSIVRQYSSLGKPAYGWSPQPMVTMWPADDKAAEHRAVALAAYQHMYRTWIIDLDWAQKSMQAMASATQAFVQNSNEQITARREAMKRFTEDMQKRTGELMDQFNQHMAIKDDFTRKVVNYALDRTDVVDPATGETYKVGSGYTNYYHDSKTGLIVGTNSPDRPPIDFTPLQQF